MDQWELLLRVDLLVDLYLRVLKLTMFAIQQLLEPLELLELEALSEDLFKVDLMVLLLQADLLVDLFQWAPKLALQLTIQRLEQSVPHVLVAL